MTYNVHERVKLTAFTWFHYQLNSFRPFTSQQSTKPITQPMLSITTSPPQSHLGRAHRYPHIGECTFPLLLLAVACTMCNEVLWKHYGTLQERHKMLRKRCTSLGHDTERYRALRDVTERYGSITGCGGVLQNITEALWKSCGVLCSIMEHYRASKDVMERYGSIENSYRTIRECYGALTERNGTVKENIDFAYQ